MSIELELTIYIFFAIFIRFIYIRLVQECEDVSPMFVSAIQSPLQNTPFSHKTQKQRSKSNQREGKEKNIYNTSLNSICE